MLDNFYPKIVFFGTPDFAVASLKALIENNFTVLAVVTSPDKPAGRGRKVQMSAVKEYAVQQQLPVLQPEKLKNAEFLDRLRSFEADLQVVVAFRMLPEVVWNMPPLGTINVHASLLPQYRGAAPINWAIINGEKETGVTTFKLQHQIDTGPLLLQKRIPIPDSDNLGILYEKLMNAGAELLVTTIKQLKDNALKEQPQDLNLETKHAPKIFKEDGRIDWNLNSKSIHNLIRGLSPYPGAYTFLDDKQLKIYQSSFSSEPTDLQPGEYQTDQKAFLKFATKDGWLHCLEVQYEGKKRMNIEDFLRGFRFS